MLSFLRGLFSNEKKTCAGASRKRLRFEPLEERRLMAMGDIPIMPTVGEPSFTPAPSCVAPANALNGLAVEFAGSGGFWSWRERDQLWTKLDETPALWTVAGDLDGNGRSELIVAKAGLGLFVYKDNGERHKIFSGEASTAAVVDVNGDGVNELLVSVADPGEDESVAAGIWCYTPADKRWFWQHHWAAESMTVVDRDGNGRPEVVVNFLETAVNPNPGLWILGDTGSWKWLHNFNVGWVAAGDLNANGKSEIVANFGGGVGIWTYRDSGVWELVQRLDSPSAAVADANGDGINELFVSVTTASAAGLWQYQLDAKQWRHIHPWVADNLLAGDFNGTFSGLAVDFGAKGLWRYAPGSSWQFVHAWNPSQLVGLKTEGVLGESPNSPQTQNWYAWVDLMPGYPGNFHVIGQVYVGNPGVKASLRARYPLAATPDLLQLDLYVQQQHPENAWIQVMTWTEARFEIDAGSTSARYKQVQVFSNGNLIKTMDVQEVW